jgi:uncharacterized membrane protein HdeD (DUF308 family)
MEENSMNKSQESVGEKELCPMSMMCKGMMEKRGSRFLFLLPGAILVALGVLILVKPAVLVWLIASISIIFGIMMLVMASFMIRMSARFEST